MDVKARTVRVHIRELVLEGVAPGDRNRVGDAVQAELARLLASPGGAEFRASAARVDAGAIEVSPGSAMGPQVAQAIYQGLRK